MSQTVNRRISIFIDSAQGEAALEKLYARQTKLATSTAKLKQGSDEWVKGMEDLGRVEKEIVQLEGQMAGRLGPTLKQLKEEQKMLNRELNKMPIELRAASNESQRLRQVEAAIRRVNNEAKQTGGWFSQWKGAMAAGAAGVVGGNLVNSALGGVKDYITGSVAAAAKVADQLADVRKTTGMTADEVDRLNSALGMIDTRTSASELREMAKVAGQFGIAQDQILGFVQAVDKVNVALGDEFGGNAEAIAAEMSKLRNVFSDIKSDNVGIDIAHIANALNELGASGVATSPVISDFANRIGGVGIPLGLTSAEVLGLSATLQELNVSTERGGTAIGKILKKMLTNTETFAEVAGMKIEDFTDLLNRDLYAAFVKVMEGAGKFSGKSTVLAKLIEDLEVNGAGASEVFAKLGNNTDLLQKRVDLANKTLSDTASINDEVAIKSNNLAGELDKLNKQWVKFTSGPGAKLGEMFLATVNGMVDGVKLLMSGGFSQVMDEVDARAQKAFDDFKAKEEEKANIRTKYMMSIQKLSVEQLEKELMIQKTIRSGWRVTMDSAIRSGDIDKIKEAKQAYQDLSAKMKDIDKLLKDKQNGLLADRAVKDEEAAKKAAKAAQKMADDFKKLQQEIADLQEKTYQDGLDKHEKELRAVEVKYQKLMARAVGHTKELRQLQELLYKEQAHLLDQWIAENSKNLDKEAKDFIRKEREKTDALKKEHKDRIDAEINRMMLQADLDLARAKTDDQRIQAEKDKLLAQTTRLLENDKLTAEERRLIWEKYDTDIAAIEQNAQLRRISDMQSYSSEVMSVLSTISQFYQAVLSNDLAALQMSSRLRLETEQRTHSQSLNNIKNTHAQEISMLNSKKERGKMTEAEYNSEINRLTTEKNDKELREMQRFENEKFRIQEEQNRRERESRRRMAIMQKIAAVTDAGIDLAVLAFKAAAQGFLNPLTNFKLAAATFKFGLLSAMPIPEFVHGGTTVKAMGQQSGKVYNTTYVGSIAGGGVADKPQLGIIGEKGTELIIPNWLFTHPKMVNTMGALQAMISARQFEDGGSTAPVTLPASSNNDERISALINQNNSVMMLLLERLNTPFYGTIIYDQLEDVLERMNSIKSKA